VDTTQKPNLSHISLCFGYGGIDLGLHRIFGDRLRLAAVCEIEAFALENALSKMEAGLLPPAPIWNDLRTFPWEEFQDVSLVSGGFPCQPFSAAGKRDGDQDPRHLFPFIIDGIKRCRPGLVFLENVEGILSSKLTGEGWADPAGTPVLLHVLRELERVGYKATAGIFSASEVGAPHQRKRVFIMAYLKCAGLEGFRPDPRQSKESQLGDCGGEGCGELADTSSAGHAVDAGSICRSKGEAWRKDVLEPQHCGATAWPSRPGQPQYGWEPPRVVANTISGWGQQAGSQCGSGEVAADSGCKEGTGDQQTVIPDDQGSNGGAGEDVENTICSGREESEYQQANLPSEPSGGDSEIVGNSKIVQCNGSNNNTRVSEQRKQIPEFRNSSWETTMGNSSSERPYRGSEDGNWEQPEMFGARPENMGNSKSGWTGECGNKDSQREGLGSTWSGSGGDMGNTEQLLFPASREHGAMDEASGIPADRERSESTQADSEPSATRKRESDRANASECSEIEQPMGYSTHGTESRLGISELSGLSNSELAKIREWMVKTDNRTDELRLLGNGVVPATATRAFLTLLEKLNG